MNALNVFVWLQYSLLATPTLSRMTWKIERSIILDMFLWSVESFWICKYTTPSWGFEVRCLGRCHWHGEARPSLRYFKALLWQGLGNHVDMQIHRMRPDEILRQRQQCIFRIHHTVWGHILANRLYSDSVLKSTLLVPFPEHVISGALTFWGCWLCGSWIWVPWQFGVATNTSTTRPKMLI